MAKRLSDKQKEEIVIRFRDGYSVDQIAEEFNCTKLTISRNLKKNIGEKEYKSLKDKKFLSYKISPVTEKRDESLIISDQDELKKNIEDIEVSDFSQFIEITPLNEDIENSPQKDLSSVPISEMSLPKVVYMVVDKKIELEIKTLNDYPDWQFLSDDELKRKTIEIFLDLKIAKSNCRSGQKVIKVPNTKVFELAAPILNSRGISRIVSDNRLIAL